MKKEFKFKAGSRKIVLDSNVQLMGVVNITPDSFFDGGDYFEKEAALDRVFELVENGASLIDIGGESSRPRSLPVSVEEELSRILPVLNAVKGKLDIPVSVDTYKSEVASVALAEGAEPEVIGEKKEEGEEGEKAAAPEEGKKEKEPEKKEKK